MPGTIPGGYRLNLAALRQAQKPSRGVAAYSRHINRPAARRVAAAAQLVGLTPNGATMISATLSAVGLVLLATLPPSPLLGLGVSLLLAGGYVMDSVDGQLARLRGGGSLSGEMLDHAVDCVKTVSLHVAVAISLLRSVAADDHWILGLPLAFLIVDTLSFFGLVTLPLLRRLHGSAAAAGPAAPEHPLRRWILLPTDYGIFCWMFLLLGWPSLFVLGYAAMFAANAVALVPALIKWSRELRRMDEAAR